MWFKLQAVRIKIVGQNAVKFPVSLSKKMNSTKFLKKIRGEGGGGEDFN